jgi:hypothetical protein
LGDSERFGDGDAQSMFELIKLGRRRWLTAKSVRQITKSRNLRRVRRVRRVFQQDASVLKNGSFATSLCTADNLVAVAMNVVPVASDETEKKELRLKRC